MNKLMTHVVAGYPTFEKSIELVKTLSASGSDYIEIQFPFTDPIADGETIQAANIDSIAEGMTTELSFDLLGAVKDVEADLIIMTYFNIVFTYGVSEFCKRALECNCVGFIVPDLPFDSLEFAEFESECKHHGLKLFYVVSTLTQDDRLDQILKVANGFIYCISKLGTTGGKFELNDDLISFVGKLKSKTKLPIALGFGIRNLEHVEKAISIADIAVIGSQIIREFNAGGTDSVEKFVLEMKNV